MTVNYIQSMMCLAYSHFMCPCSLLLHIDLYICSDWIEVTKSLRSVEGGEQNAAGEWRILQMCVNYVGFNCDSIL